MSRYFNVTWNSEIIISLSSSTLGLLQKLKDIFGSVNEYVLYFIRSMSPESLTIFACGGACVYKGYEIYS